MTSPSRHIEPNLASQVRLLQEELAATNREVLLLTLELEQRVAERTAQLSQTNQELEREVAERRRAEEEIRQLNEALAQRADLLATANEELEAFAHSVSHDLRGPARHIAGFAAILRDHTEGRRDPQEQELLDKISSSAKRMGTLIEDLLRFSRISYLELSKSEIDLNELLASVIGELQPEIRGRSITWKLDSLPVLHADRNLLRQVLVNLISNAVKYTGRRDQAEIEVGSREEQDQTICFVRDNGVGFDSHYQDKLFGVFKRLHTQEEFEGTGIGLANVRRIIERHGGRVWAEGAPGEGATFYFSLPRATGL